MCGRWSREAANPPWSPGEFTAGSGEQAGREPRAALCPQPRAGCHLAAGRLTPTAAFCLDSPAHFSPTGA